VLCPLTMNLYYACGAWGDKINSDKRPHPVTASTPCFRNIHFSGITARGVKYAAGFMIGLAEMPLENISFQDVEISMSPDSEAGFPEMADDLEKMSRVGLMIGNVCGLSLDHVQIIQQSGPAILLSNANQVRLEHCGTTTVSAASPFITLKDVNGCFVEGCQVPDGTKTFLEVAGGDSQNIRIFANNFYPGAQAVDLKDVCSPEAVILYS